MSGALNWRISVALVIAVCVLALVGVAYGVLTHSEPGLVRVCDGQDAHARYSPPAVCEAHDLVWPRGRMPLRVSPRTPAIEAAVREVNRQLGVPLLRFGEPADVHVTLGVPHGSGWHDTAATTWHDLIPQLSAEIRVGNVPDVETLHAVLVHELGHALGLDHDDAEDSVMYRVAGSVRFTDADRATLRELYGSP